MEEDDGSVGGRSIGQAVTRREASGQNLILRFPLMLANILKELRFFDSVVMKNKAFFKLLHILKPRCAGYCCVVRKSQC
ncbi:unnamed protein product [Cylicostephanus goldi]|uniref:Uncharacterized protein n=1 Tax=Cylicostephanus goldi TaxID=71465 RepID=A0A3P6QR03_CYLGO|nr:unnamed protein product [Cylicostephanus goldi]